LSVSISFFVVQILFAMGVFFFSWKVIDMLLFYLGESVSLVVDLAFAW